MVFLVSDLDHMPWMDPGAEGVAGGPEQDLHLVGSEKGGWETIPVSRCLVSSISPLVLDLCLSQGFCTCCSVPTTILLPWASSTTIRELVTALNSLFFKPREVTKITTGDKSGDRKSEVFTLMQELKISPQLQDFLWRKMLENRSSDDQATDSDDVHNTEANVDVVLPTQPQSEINLPHSDYLAQFKNSMLSFPSTKNVKIKLPRLDLNKMGIEAIDTSVKLTDEVATELRDKFRKESAAEPTLPGRGVYYRCTVCETVMVDRETVRKHFLLVHLGESSFKQIADKFKVVGDCTVCIACEKPMKDGLMLLEHECIDYPANFDGLVQLLETQAVNDLGSERSGDKIEPSALAKCRLCDFKCSRHSLLYTHLATCHFNRKKLTKGRDMQSARARTDPAVDQPKYTADSNAKVSSQATKEHPSSLGPPDYQVTSDEVFPANETGGSLITQSSSKDNNTKSPGCHTENDDLPADVSKEQLSKLENKDGTNSTKDLARKSCHICQRVFQRRSPLLIHYCHAHFKDQVLQHNQGVTDHCTLCGKDGFRSPAMLLVHVGLVHKVVKKLLESEKNKEENNSFPNRSEPKKTKQKLSRHENFFGQASSEMKSPNAGADNIESGGEANACLICSKDFNKIQRSNIIQHYARAHFTKSIVAKIKNKRVCSLCGYAAPNIWAMIYHYGGVHHFVDKLLAAKLSSHGKALKSTCKTKLKVKFSHKPTPAVIDYRSSVEKSTDEGSKLAGKELTPGNSDNSSNSNKSHSDGNYNCNRDTRSNSTSNSNINSKSSTNSNSNSNTNINTKSDSSSNSNLSSNSNFTSNIKRNNSNGNKNTKSNSSSKSENSSNSKSYSNITSNSSSKRGDTKSPKPASNIFTCGICQNFHSVKRTKLYCHYAAKHFRKQISSLIGKGLECPYCGLRSQSFWANTIHVGVVHSKVDDFLPEEFRISKYQKVPTSSLDKIPSGHLEDDAGGDNGVSSNAVYIDYDEEEDEELIEDFDQKQIDGWQEAPLINTADQDHGTTVDDNDSCVDDLLCDSYDDSEDDVEETSLFNEQLDLSVEHIEILEIAVTDAIKKEIDTFREDEDRATEEGTVSPSAKKGATPRPVLILKSDNNCPMITDISSKQACGPSKILIDDIRSITNNDQQKENLEPDDEFWTGIVEQSLPSIPTVENCEINTAEEETFVIDTSEVPEDSEDSNNKTGDDDMVWQPCETNIENLSIEPKLTSSKRKQDESLVDSLVTEMDVQAKIQRIDMQSTSQPNLHNLSDNHEMEEEDISDAAANELRKNLQSPSQPGNHEIEEEDIGYDSTAYGTGQSHPQNLAEINKIQEYEEDIVQEKVSNLHLSSGRNGPNEEGLENQLNYRRARCSASLTLRQLTSRPITKEVRGSCKEDNDAASCRLATETEVESIDSHIEERPNSMDGHIVVVDKETKDSAQEVREQKEDLQREEDFPSSSVDFKSQQTDLKAPVNKTAVGTVEQESIARHKPTDDHSLGDNADQNQSGDPDSELNVSAHCSRDIEGPSQLEQPKKENYCHRSFANLKIDDADGIPGNDDSAGYFKAKSKSEEVNAENVIGSEAFKEHQMSETLKAKSEEINKVVSMTTLEEDESKMQDSVTTKSGDCDSSHDDDFAIDSIEKLVCPEELLHTLGYPEGKESEEEEAKKTESRCSSDSLIGRPWSIRQSIHGKMEYHPLSIPTYPGKIVSYTPKKFRKPAFFNKADLEDHHSYDQFNDFTDKSEGPSDLLQHGPKPGTKSTSDLAKPFQAAKRLVENENKNSNRSNNNEQLAKKTCPSKNTEHTEETLQKIIKSFDRSSNMVVEVSPNKLASDKNVYTEKSAFSANNEGDKMENKKAEQGAENDKDRLNSPNKEHSAASSSLSPNLVVVEKQHNHPGVRGTTTGVVISTSKLVGIDLRGNCFMSGSESEETDSDSD